MVILDGTIVNVALPTIRTDLGFTDTGLAWVVNGFFVAFALLLLPAGRLGDLVGTRRVFVAGLVLFTAATALCGLASSPTSLVAARVAQGVGGALTSAVVLGMIAGLYADQAARRAGLRAGRVRRFRRCVDRRRRRRPAHRAGVLAVGVPGQRPARCGGPGRRVRRPGRDAGRSGCAAGWPQSRALVPRVLLTRPAFLLPNAVLFTMTVAGFSFQFLTALYLQDTLGLDALTPAWPTCP